MITKIMMSKWKAMLALMLGMSSMAFAQEDARAWRCGTMRGNIDAMATGAKATVADAAEDDYDVRYLKFDLEMSNTSTALQGSVTTRAVVVASAMPKYVFELQSPLVVDSVVLNGTTYMPTASGDARIVVLATPLPLNAMFTAQVFYHGTPPSGTASNAKGINSVNSPSWGNRVTFTQSESYKAKTWWPCKQSLTDKIDSVDMWVTVQDSLKVGSNGLLAAVTPIDATHHRYEWKERIPIDQYLISVAISTYIDYSYYAHFSGSTDSVLVQNYVYSNPGTLPNFRSVIDSTALMLDHFSKLYGRYPFWREKYGHCMAPLSGGMEHQTMTTLGFFEGWLVAHELGHQWFGDNVTCGTWADITMNEGFASYTEYLYKDHFWSHTAALSDIYERQQNVMSEPGGAVYVDDINNETRIFDSRLSYDKGACVIHTLRSVLNNDINFFGLLQTWQSQQALGTGTIAEFRNTVTSLFGNVVNGINIDTFFNQWMYGQGYPIYNVRWNQVGEDVYIHLDQSTSMPLSVPLFKVPLEIRLNTSTGGNTVVGFVNDQASQTYHFTSTFPVSSIGLDPNRWLTYDLNSLTRDVTLGVGDMVVSALTIHPNPGTTVWNIEHMQPGSDLTLTDMAGKVLWTGRSAAGTSMAIPAEGLAPGLYILRMGNEAGCARAYKLVKQ